LHGIAVETKKKGDEQRLFEVLHKLEMEDPCFKLERHATTKRNRDPGAGELHMRVSSTRCCSSTRWSFSVKPPKIPYRETVTRLAEGHCRHKNRPARRPVRRSVLAGGAAARARAMNSWTK